MTFTGATHSHESDEWYTPPEVYRALDAEFAFEFDPFPASNGGTLPFNGLTVPWKSRNFVNPPYSIVGKALAKGYAESQRGNLSVFLIFARTETRAWHAFIVGRENVDVEVRFVAGRLCFISPTGKSGTATAPNAVVVMHPIGTKAPHGIVGWTPTGATQTRLGDHEGEVLA